MNNKNHPFYKTIIDLFNIGFKMIFSILLLTFLGFYIGKKTSMQNTWLIIGLLSGILSGSYLSWKTVNNFLNSTYERKNNKD